MMTLEEMATKWREQYDCVGKGGVVVIFGDTVNSWVNELRDPDHWRPGSIAVDEAGNKWVASGGNDTTGAREWKPF